MYSWEVGVVASIFYFKRIDVLAFSCYYIWQGVEAWVAYWYANGIVAFFLQEFDKHGFTVEASFSPTPKFYSVNLCAQRFLLLNACIYRALEIKIVPQEHSRK